MTARAPIRAFVHLPTALDAEAHRTRWEQGSEPDASPYGFHEAESSDLTVAFSHAPARRGIIDTLLAIGRMATGLDLPHAWRNRAAIAAADIVWTMLEGEAVAILLLARIGLLPRRPMIVGTVWIFDRWERLRPSRRRVYTWLLRDAAIITVHARPCLDRLRAVLPESDGRLMHFGVAARAFAPAESPAKQGRPIHIVAAGHDRTRDWQVLLDAFGNDPRFRLAIVCRWFDRAELARYDNLAVPEPASMIEVRDLYRAADYVAVPMVPNLFSGITVAIEAAACGVPILSSRTGGVPTYFDEDEALFVAPGDPHAMRERVLAQSAAERAAMAERARCRFLSDDYSTRGMMRRYRALTDEILRR